MSRTVETTPRPACVFCGKSPRTPAFSPFCSAGCQDRDLLQWMKGGYALPAGDNEEELLGNPSLDNDVSDG